MLTKQSIKKIEVKVAAKPAAAAGIKVTDGDAEISGTEGKGLTIKTSLDRTTAKVGETITVTVVINGKATGTNGTKITFSGPDAISFVASTLVGNSDMKISTNVTNKTIEVETDNNIDGKVIQFTYTASDTEAKNAITVAVEDGEA